MTESKEEKQKEETEEAPEAYEPEYPRTSNKVEQVMGNDDDKERVIGDEFDLYEMASRVHSNTGGLLTRDFTLSDMDEEVFHNKLSKFIKEQIKVILIITGDMQIPLNVLEERYSTKKKAQKIYDGLEEIAKKTKDLLMSEIIVLWVSSRARKGKVLRAVLHPEKKDDPLEEETDTRTAIQKLADKIRKKKK